jgi:hypothetical protein
METYDYNLSYSGDRGRRVMSSSLLRKNWRPYLTNKNKNKMSWGHSSRGRENS